MWRRYYIPLLAKHVRVPLSILSNVKQTVMPLAVQYNTAPLSTRYTSYAPSGPDRFWSHRSRQMFVQLLKTEYKQQSACTGSGFLLNSFNITIFWIYNFMLINFFNLVFLYINSFGELRYIFIGLYSLFFQNPWGWQSFAETCKSVIIVIKCALIGVLFVCSADLYRYVEYRAMYFIIF